MRNACTERLDRSCREVVLHNYVFRTVEEIRERKEASIADRRSYCGVTTSAI